ncbi:MAG: hypothetical protein KJZ93_02845 [Caldilineaceae bacterium]|nr:hypothetical protein [Caldilineaceae bacterium]
MKKSSALVWLSSLVALLALVSAGAGLFWPGEGNPFPFTTLRGQAVEIYGQGLYRYDTAFKAPILRGTDGVTLLVGIPLLVWAIARYRRNSLRGGLLLTGVLSYFLYKSASLAFGVAYNDLILVYIVYFSASFFAFMLAFTSIDLADLAARMSPDLPHGWVAAFMFLAGLSVFVWLIDIIGGLAQGGAPANLASYTTEITYPIDLGLIAPAAFLGGVLVLRRTPLGYLIAATLLTLNAMVGVMVVGQSIAQTLAGITLSVVEWVAFVGTFVGMSGIAVWLLTILFRHLADSPR